jgi:hypothetical protein
MLTINPDIWEFPCQHDIKVLGLAHHPLVDIVIALVTEHVGSCDTASIRTKPSSSGKYISVTATVQFTSKEQLEALYRALHARDEVTQTL